MAIGQIGFLGGMWGALGVAVVIGVIALIYRLGDSISEWFNKREQKPKLVLNYEKDYLKHELYEELFYINKYRDQLKKGEWPDEMDEKFEMATEKETSAGLDSEGFIYTYKKNFLRLKDKFRSKKEVETTDNQEGQDSNESEEQNKDDKK